MQQNRAVALAERQEVPPQTTRGCCTDHMVVAFGNSRSTKQATPACTCPNLAIHGLIMEVYYM